MLAVAGEGLVHDVVDVLEGRRGRNDLERGTRRVPAFEEPVHVDGVPALLRRVDIRLVLDVERRERHGHEDFAGLVVVDTDTALFVPLLGDGLVRGGGQAGVDGERQVVGRLLHGVETVDEVVARELRRERGLRAGGDVSFGVADDVQGGFPDGGTGVVLPVAVDGLHQDVAVAVVERGAAHEAARGIDVFVVGLHDPLAGVRSEQEGEDAESDEERDGEQVHPFGPFKDSIHRLHAPPQDFRPAQVRLSAALMNARRPQQEMVLEPPRDTKGRVTPVMGRRSVTPKMLRALALRTLWTKMTM